MKSKCVFASVILISIFTTRCFAQNESVSFIPSEHLSITYNKTTNLIFPYSVQSIDRGSKDILVQQPKGTENVVQVKADKPNFTQTNLSIITIDGQLYSFTVDYALQPAELNLIIPKRSAATIDSSTKQAVQLTSAHNEALFQEIAQKINATKEKHVKRNKDNQMELDLNGIYINHDVLYFRLQVKNNSNINYDIDNIRFSLKDRQKSTRIATQELELMPVYTYHNVDKVQADSLSNCIIALSKFTLPDSKYLSIQMFEKNGSRNFSLALKNKNIMKAKIISNIN